MSLPISGAGPRGPQREPTHKALDHRRMMNLGLAAEDAASDADEGEGQSITCDAIDELALEEGVDAGYLYAAIAVTTELQVAREHDVAFIACGGNCQHWGALECLERLATLRQQRIDDGAPGFDIQARQCLDKCEQAPVVTLHTTSGTAVIERANKKKIDEAVAAAFDAS